MNTTAPLCLKAQSVKYTAMLLSWNIISMSVSVRVFESAASGAWGGVHQVLESICISSSIRGACRLVDLETVHATVVINWWISKSEKQTKTTTRYEFSLLVSSLLPQLILVHSCSCAHPVYRLHRRRTCSAMERKERTHPFLPKDKSNVAAVWRLALAQRTLAATTTLQKS